jgi:hypothetical protein
MSNSMTKKILVVGLMALSPAIRPAIAGDAMSVSLQNGLVQRYCAVCHTDAQRNGGLSLQHFDASHANPAEAAMMLAKLKTGAIGAAGIPTPDSATVEAWTNATAAEAAGANDWTIDRAQSEAAKGPIVTASIVREAPSAAFPAQPDLYRLTLTCHLDTHESEMQLAWSPATPKSGQMMSVAIDGKTPSTYKIEGSEQMGNGTGGGSGPGAILLNPTKLLPARTLTISNLFPDETVVFPFDGPAKNARQALAACFAGGGKAK